ncbi:hypothetical protein PI126_g13582 [Phytophthora idaei]|nr:hypothetical protein PI126_g13582 [Phytophthora idaei]
MLELTEEDFAQRQPQADADNVLARTLPAEHVPRENPDYQIVNGQRKRRQRQCKVCSNRKRSVGKRQATKYYCPGCSSSDKARYITNAIASFMSDEANSISRTYLCNKDRRRPGCGRDIQSREAGIGAGKRKRHRRQQNGGYVESADDNDEDTAENKAESDVADGQSDAVEGEEEGSTAVDIEGVVDGEVEAEVEVEENDQSANSRCEE